jgi:hypothetical protein
MEEATAVDLPFLFLFPSHISFTQCLEHGTVDVFDRSSFL